MDATRESSGSIPPTKPESYREWVHNRRIYVPILIEVSLRLELFWFWVVGGVVQHGPEDGGK